jgi:hypothetical protein
MGIFMRRSRSSSPVKTKVVPSIFGIALDHLSGATDKSAVTVCAAGVLMTASLCRRGDMPVAAHPEALF